MEEKNLAAKERRQPDEVSVKEVIHKIRSLNRYLFSRWIFIVTITFLTALAGLIYAFTKATSYTAECTFVLEEEGGSSGGGLGQYSALASMAGIDVSNGSGLFQGDNIIELYKSRLMIQKTLLTKANFNGKQELLIERYISLNKLRDKWDNNPKLKSLNFNIPVNEFSLQHDSVISTIVLEINKNYLVVDKPDKKLSIISVKTKSKDELFSKMFTLTIVDNVNNFYVQTKTKKSLQNVVLLQVQMDSIRRVLNSSINGSAAAMDENPNPNPSLLVLRAPSQRKQVDVQANTAIYAEVVKNLEISRAALQRETPLIQVIDQPILPLPNDKVSKLKTILIGGIIGLILAVFYLSIIKVYQKIMY